MRVEVHSRKVSGFPKYTKEVVARRHPRVAAVALPASRVALCPMQEPRGAPATVAALGLGARPALALLGKSDY